MEPPSALWESSCLITPQTQFPSRTFIVVHLLKLTTLDSGSKSPLLVHFCSNLHRTSKLSLVLTESQLFYKIPIFFFFQLWFFFCHVYAFEIFSCFSKQTCMWHRLHFSPSFLPTRLFDPCFMHFIPFWLQVLSCDTHLKLFHSLNFF